MSYLHKLHWACIKLYALNSSAHVLLVCYVQILVEDPTYMQTFFKFTYSICGHIVNDDIDYFNIILCVSKINTYRAEVSMTASTSTHFGRLHRHSPGVAGVETWSITTMHHFLTRFRLLKSSEEVRTVSNMTKILFGWRTTKFLVTFESRTLTVDLDLWV